jgi:hypothetical protein
LGENFNQTEPGEIEKVPLIWKTFNENGFVTAYAEDRRKLGTFIYFKKYGFLHPPTTYYFRPFTIAAEKYLKEMEQNHSIVCVGYQHSADYTYQHMLDFATQFKNDPFFGFFWSTSVAHEDWLGPTAMDLRIKFYLEELENRGILNISAVVFFSDHGDRFSAIRSCSVSLKIKT